MRRNAIKLAQRPDSRADMAYARLRQLAYAKGPDAKLPTREQICADLQFSRTTVDSALDLLERQSIIYRRQGSGIYVSPTIHRKTIVVLFASDFFESQMSPFWGMLWSRFARQAQARSSVKDEDFQFHLVTPQPEGEPQLPEQIVREIDAGKVDGILCVGMPATVFFWLEGRGVPNVSYAGPGKWEVEGAVRTATEMAVRCLVEDGCRAIGLWRHEVEGDILQSEPIGWFEAALAERGLTLDPSLVVGFRASAPGAPRLSYQEEGHHAARRCFTDPAGRRPDGIVIQDDMLTDGAIAALEELGVCVGEDVKIAAFTNLGSPILFGHRKKLTRIEFDPSDIPATMLNILDQAMAGKGPAEKTAHYLPALRRRDE
jgi:DNA-binding LacI/PurR family transcriptional regulator